MTFARAFPLTALVIVVYGVFRLVVWPWLVG